jgi:ABC-type glycerol-3-phosphate transport system substrate-binding protein
MEDYYMKRFFSFAALLALGVSLAFAGGGGQQGSSSGAAKDKVVVSIINPYYTAGWNRMAREYTALHPETEVVIDVVADNDTYFQKMTTWLSASDLSNSADMVHANFAAGPMGGYDVMYNKGMLYDFTPMLDEPNPYNGGKPVRSVFSQNDIRQFVSTLGMYGLPFDNVGIAFIYNATLLKKHNIAVPGTVEDLLAACEKLKQANAVSYPIAATAEASWYLTALTDAALRSREHEFLVQPGDALWDPALMSANENFRFNENDWTSDQWTRFSAERVALYQKQNGLNNPLAVAVWEEFAKIGKYFNENHANAASTEIMTSFEMGNAAFLLSGSWNVGSINKDLSEMPNPFEWGTFSFLPYRNPPQGFQAKLRTLYGVGNHMGIIITRGRGEHLERVKDFYKFVYSPEGAQKMYEATLAAGNFVQGPPAIAGVKLSPDLNAKLEGFVQEGAVKADFGGLVGQSVFLQSDSGTYYANVENLVSGRWTARDFVQRNQAVFEAAIDDNIKKNGFDLDPKTKDTPLQ